jgi:catechol 2,3-dioxygenase-like lactoylglutathione lyase family enzyme
MLGKEKVRSRLLLNDLGDITQFCRRVETSADGDRPGGYARAMGESPRFALTSTVLGAPDARELARFYRALLGWTVRADEPGWVVLAAPGGGAGLSFQTEDAYVRPVWPDEPGRQQMMLHLDIAVEDLGAAVERATALGADLADHQPQEDVRVCLDPAGHPFCLYTP